MSDRPKHDEAYWQMPVTDYVSAGSPPPERVFANREQLNETWINTIARFSRNGRPKA
jgi:hypothetical protein